MLIVYFNCKSELYVGEGMALPSGSSFLLSLKCSDVGYLYFEILTFNFSVGLANIYS